MKQALLNEARQGAKASKGTRPAQKALERPAKGDGKAATKPPKKKAKAAKAASKPSKHRKGPPKPKAPGSKVKK